MTVETAAEVYGLTSWNALSKRIKYAKGKGELPDDTPHFKGSLFTEETAKLLGLEPLAPGEANEQSQNQDGEAVEPPKPIQPVAPAAAPIKRRAPKPNNPPRYNSRRATPSVEQVAPTTEEEPTKLQKQLSANWLIKWVLYSLILADGIAFAVIADRKIEMNYVEQGFFYLGVMCGVGAIAMYCKIKKFKDAETFKYIYGLLQFIVFEVAIQTSLFSWETCMTIMIIVVEMGVMHSIRK